MSELTEALNSAHDTIVFHSKDWASNKRDAWLYGILVGWDNSSYKELREKFKWSEEDINRNKRLRKAIEKVINY